MGRWAAIWKVQVCRDWMWFLQKLIQIQNLIRIPPNWSLRNQNHLLLLANFQRVLHCQFKIFYKGPKHQSHKDSRQQASGIHWCPTQALALGFCNKGVLQGIRRPGCIIRLRIRKSFCTQSPHNQDQLRIGSRINRMHLLLKELYRQHSCRSLLCHSPDPWGISGRH